MNDKAEKAYWRSEAERAGQADGHPAGVPAAEMWPLNRRQFLEAAGFSTVSLAVVGGCGRAPSEAALPFAVQPEGMVPGRMRSYASTCFGCPAGCGLLVGVRDGRPLKMEGMPEHPLSHGGLCAIGQALPLGLYDSHRLTQPLLDHQPSTWDKIDAAMQQRLEQLKASGGAVRFVTSTVTSPTLRANIDAFLRTFADARHVTLGAVSCSAILDAHRDTHGARLLPHLQLAKARVIVSFGADFLGTWISPVEFTAAWRTRRTPTAERPEMSYHVQLEGRMSLTGSNADRRIRLAPDEYGVVLSHLAVKLSELAGAPGPTGALGASPLSDEQLTELATRLWDARGESLVLCDSQDVAVQRLVNYINHTLGNYGATLDIQQPSLQRQENDADVLHLVEELRAGDVAALFVAGTDLTHHLPQRDELVAAIGKVPLVVSFAEREDDFAALAHFVCPDHHPLESWLDAEPIKGLVSLSQPTLAPLGQTRSILESLARWSGRAATAYELLRAHWKEHVLPRLETQPLRLASSWDQAVHDGFVRLTPEADAASEFRADSAGLLPAPPVGQDLALSLYCKVGLTDSRHAHNPWLQELPDPITKVTWDNYVCVSPALGQRLGVTDGDVVRVDVGEDAQVELPAFIQPGQHDRVVAIALGYGVRGTERFANIGPRWLESRPTLGPDERVGQNAAGLIECREGALRYTRAGVVLTKTDRRRRLASTQTHHSLHVPPNVAPYGAEVREPIEETTLAAFVKNPAAGAAEMHHAEQQLWPEDHPKTGHSWGMAVDLNACTGCSACLIACQSENNVPVVGKDEVYRRREMHWIRVDRYYSGDGDDVDVVHQPMMCQHCGNAPCETVCPVLATVHSEEGLNEQAYNRCVGTRYCANNCPYKVRRFNWFRYTHDDPLQNLAFNPDVTVRGRGVMEKCSMCVHRIEDGKLEAKRRGQPLADGSIQTACQQSCPAQAIVFGDMRDPTSQIHAALEDPRRYRVLEEFNFRPSVAYLRVVRNREATDSQGGEHV
jgi:molybdopterin-containing oxidoreductase family iron-sulfur binding subunit